MSDTNVLVITGRLTRDPEVRQAGNSQVAGFGVASNRVYKKGDEFVEQVSFYDVDYWGEDRFKRQIENGTLKKGRKIQIEGRIEQDRWEDKDGQKRSRIKIIARRIVSMHVPEPGSGGNKGETERTEGSVNAENADDEVPF